MDKNHKNEKLQLLEQALKKADTACKAALESLERAIVDGKGSIQHLREEAKEKSRLRDIAQNALERAQNEED